MAMLRILLTVLALFAAPLSARAAEAVDLLLVLAADVSRSVDQPKFQLQRDGYAAAITDPRVMNAIMSGATRRIAVCFVEWSGAGAQKVVIDWTMLDGPDAARKFSDALVEAPRSFADRTSISGAIDFSMEMLARVRETFGCSNCGLVRPCGRAAIQTACIFKRQAHCFEPFQTDAVWNHSNLLICHRNLP
jgi:hypothetical protein